LDDSGEPKCVTPPAASEVLVGGYYLGGRYLERCRTLVDALPLLAFDRESCHEAAKIGAILSARGIRLGQADLFIAAISRRHGHLLVTRDRAFAQIPGLPVETL
jgi:predicted nucleic acid-binding protein